MNLNLDEMVREIENRYPELNPKNIRGKRIIIDGFHKLGNPDDQKVVEARAWLESLGFELHVNGGRFLAPPEEREQPVASDAWVLRTLDDANWGTFDKKKYEEMVAKGFAEPHGNWYRVTPAGRRVMKGGA